VCVFSPLTRRACRRGERRRNVSFEESARSSRGPPSVFYQSYLSCARDRRISGNRARNCAEQRALKCAPTMSLTSRMKNRDAIILTIANVGQEIIATCEARSSAVGAADAARAYSHVNKFSGALPAIQRVRLSRGACLAATRA